MKDIRLLKAEEISAKVKTVYNGTHCFSCTRTQLT